MRLAGFVRESDGRVDGHVHDVRVLGAARVHAGELPVAPRWPSRGAAAVQIAARQQLATTPAERLLRRQVGRKCLLLQSFHHRGIFIF